MENRRPFKEYLQTFFFGWCVAIIISGLLPLIKYGLQWGAVFWMLIAMISVGMAYVVALPLYPFLAITHTPSAYDDILTYGYLGFIPLSIYFALVFTSKDTKNFRIFGSIALGIAGWFFAWSVIVLSGVFNWSP